MSGYGQQGGQQGYGQYNPYEQDGGNPYQTNSYGNTQPYSERPMPQHNTSSYYEDEERRPGGGQGGGYEMSNMNGNDPNRILTQCREIDRVIDEIESDLANLKRVQDLQLDETNTSPNSPLRQEVGRLSRDLKDKCRGIVDRVKRIKSDPASGNPRNAPQVGKVDRRIKTAMHRYEQVKHEHQKNIENNIIREIKIVQPDASDAELYEASKNPENTQIFRQALMNRDRQGEAQHTKESVQARHIDIQKIAEDFIQVRELFQDLEAAVIQQEPAVTQIEQRGEEVTDHVAKANTELDGAVTKAKAARKKKFMCLGIAVLIVIIIVVVVVVVVEVVNK